MQNMEAKDVKPGRPGAREMKDSKKKRRKNWLEKRNLILIHPYLHKIDRNLQCGMWESDRGLRAKVTGVELDAASITTTGYYPMGFGWHAGVARIYWPPSVRRRRDRAPFWI